MNTKKTGAVPKTTADGALQLTDAVATACEIVIQMKVDEGMVDLTERYAAIGTAEGDEHRLAFVKDTARAYVDPGDYLITWAVKGANDSVRWTLSVTGDVRKPVSRPKKLHHGLDGGELDVTAETL